ncbi:MAG: SOS response-associated peptidase family protein, partial [Ferruginibacter sp.]
MCLDISFKIAATEDSLYDYLPNLKIDPQLSFDLENIAHIQAQERPMTRIIYMDATRTPTLTLMRWGLMTDFLLKDQFSFNKYGHNMFNARAEKYFDPSSVWYRLNENRCLIVTPAIYEHRHIIGWKQKVPYY